MPEPKPYVVASWIADSILEEEFVPLRKVIDQMLFEHIPKWSAEQIAETGESLVPEVHREIGVIEDQWRRDGVEPTFYLDGGPESAYIKSIKNESVEVLDKLRNFDPKDFEEFCANVLTKLGADSESVGNPHDGGIDFQATNLKMPAEAGVAMRACPSLLVGQAKRYGENNLVTAHELRSFLGAAVLRADQKKREFERLGVFSPVFFAFWTTSNFNRNAREFARDTGIWCLSGLALAQLAIRLGLLH